MPAKKKSFWIFIFIIISAILIVLCVRYFEGNQVSDYDGTLVMIENL